MRSFSVCNSNGRSNSFVTACVFGSLGCCLISWPLKQVLGVSPSSYRCRPSPAIWAAVPSYDKPLLPRRQFSTLIVLLFNTTNALVFFYSDEKKNKTQNATLKWRIKDCREEQRNRSGNLQNIPFHNSQADTKQMQKVCSQSVSLSAIQSAGSIPYVVVLGPVRMVLTMKRRRTERTNEKQ